MSKRLLQCILPLMLLTVIPAQAEEVFTIGSAFIVLPDGSPLTKPAVPKQTLLMNVDTMATTWFTAPPVFPQWNISGGIAVDSSSQNLALQQRIKGKTYAGVRREFLLIPQKTGTLRLPRSDIILTPALTDKKQTVTVSTSPVEVKLPSGAGDLSSFLPGSKLTLTESIEPDSLTALQAGDAITRKVTLEVDGILATFIPAIDAGMVSEGMELYAGTPEVTAVTTGRGDFVGGRRVDTFSYLAHKEGSYTLPGITIRWWNTVTDRFEETSLAPISFDVAAAPDAGAEAVLQRGIGDKLLDNLGVVMLALIIILFGVSLMVRYQREVSRFKRQLSQTIRTRIKQIMTSEPMYFHRMMLALRFSRHQVAMQHYHKWLQARGGMEELLPPEIAIWLGKNYGVEHEIISIDDVMDSLKKSRDRYKESIRPKHSCYGLPALNH